MTPEQKAALLRALKGNQRSREEYLREGTGSVTFTDSSGQAVTLSGGLRVEGSALTATTNTITPQEDEQMSNTTTNSPFEQTWDMVKDAAAEGGKIGVAVTVNKKAIDMLEEQIGANYPELLRTPAGRKIVEGAIPTLIHLGMSTEVAEKIPNGDYVKAWSEYAVKGTAKDATEELLTLFMTVALPMLVQLGQMVKEESKASNVHFLDVPPPSVETPVPEAVKASAKTEESG